MNLSENLRRLRLARGLTQSALAEQLGVSDRAVSRWERDAALPDVTLLPRVAPPERADLLRRSNVGMLTGLLTSTLEKLSAQTGDTTYSEAAVRIRQEIDSLPL